MSPAAVIPVCPFDPIAAVPSTEWPAPRSSGAMLDEIIRRHWRSLEASHKPSAWGALERGYGDARRAYHGWEHIAELLEKLDGFEALAARPALIATAVFWHDFVLCDAGAGRRKAFGLRERAGQRRTVSPPHSPERGRRGRRP